MWRFFLARGGQYALVLLASATLNFALPRMMPGSPLLFLAGEEVGRLDEGHRRELVRRLGLDRPLWEQYVRYLMDLARGELGTSFQRGRPIADLLRERIPWTLLLMGTGLLGATAAGVVGGTWAAWRRGGSTDVGLLFTAMALESMPSFWLGLILIAVFGAHLRWFPIFGARTPGVPLEGSALLVDAARHLALPLVTLILVTAPGTFLVMRYAMLQVLGEPYIVTARAKGVGERSVLFRHAMRNALLPVCTVFMLNLGFVASGATVIETVFSYPGVGRLMYEAVLNRDYPVIQAAFFVVALSVMAANALADLLYPLIDPRVRDGRR
jgi:peptide/nickel transport system permease protein